MGRARKILCLAAPVGALALIGCQRPETATAERVDNADGTYDATPAPQRGEADVVPVSADVTPAKSEGGPVSPTTSGSTAPPAVSVTPVVATPRTDKDGRPACGNVVQKGSPRECK